MNRLPGEWLERFAAHAFPEAARERVFHPIIADMQQEYLTCVEQHHARGMNRVLLRGWTGFVMSTIMYVVTRGRKLPAPERQVHNAIVLVKAIAWNALVATMIWILLFLVTRLTAHAGWQAMDGMMIAGCALGAGLARRMRARLVEIGLMGLVVCLAAEMAMHLTYSIRAVQGAPTHFAVMIAGILGVIVGSRWGRSRATPRDFPAQLSTTVQATTAEASPQTSPRHDLWLRTLSAGGAFACILLLSPPASAQSPWRVDPAPIMDISANSPAGAPQFSRVSGATRFPNGNIVIADADEFDLHIFGPSGKFLRSVGRQGAGPGEFRHVSWMGRCTGDSLHVWDLVQHRMAVFSPAGEFARQYRLPADTSNGSSPNLDLACATSGTIAYEGEPGRSGVVPTDVPGVMRVNAPIFVADTKGAVVRQLGVHPMGEWVVIGGGQFPRPLAPTASIAVAGDRVYVGTADSARIEVFASKGPSTILKLDMPVRHTTKAQFTKASEVLASLAPKAARDRAIQGLTASPMPKYLPSFSALFGDADGVLWVQTSVVGDPATRLRAFDANKKMLGEVSLAANLTIHEIGRDYVLASYDDRDDLPHLVVYRLHRGP